MIIHKLGGASVKDIDSVKRIPVLLDTEDNTKIFIVISAMGKTTNKLEQIVNAAFESREYKNLLHDLRNQHLDMLKELVADTSKHYLLYNLFEDCEKIIENTDKTDYNFFYDQVVPFGERASSFIVSEFLNSLNFDVALIDANKIFISDNNYRAGNIDIKLSKQNLDNILSEHKNKILITQGFIGTTNDGKSVTLGREGSDYSASLIAYMTDAEKLIFWKDVPGIFSADPKVFDDAVKIDKMSYDEMVELSFFGAKVLHQKTLYALREKNINLQVKSFINPEQQGTTLYNDDIKVKYPPIKILLENQILFTVEAKVQDLVGLEQLEHIYLSAIKNNLNINLIQISATKISFCADYDNFTCDKMLKMLKDNFNVKYNKDVSILTLRHYKKSDIEKFENNNNIILSQVNRSVAQYIIEINSKY